MYEKYFYLHFLVTNEMGHLPSLLALALPYPCPDVTPILTYAHAHMHTIKLTLAHPLLS